MSFNEGHAASAVADTHPHQQQELSAPPASSIPVSHHHRPTEVPEEVYARNKGQWLPLDSYPAPKATFNARIKEGEPEISTTAGAHADFDQQFAQALSGAVSGFDMDS